MQKLEHLVERTLFASRWLLAPIYFGLSLALVALGVKFFQEALEAFSHLFAMREADLVLMVLGMIDIVLVMFSGYENFVSKIDVDNAETLGWLGKLDAGTLKLKVAASIVAISSIHLLRIFVRTESTPNDKIKWYVIIHLTFVISAVMLGVLDRMAFAKHREH